LGLVLVVGGYGGNCKIFSRRGAKDSGEYRQAASASAPAIRSDADEERLKENPAVGAAGKLGELEMNAHTLPPMAACYKAHFVSGRD